MNDVPELVEMKRRANMKSLKEMALLVRYIRLLYSCDFLILIVSRTYYVKAHLTLVFILKLSICLKYVKFHLAVAFHLFLFFFFFKFQLPIVHRLIACKVIKCLGYDIS